MARLKHDDTLTKLGDIYHYLLVLKYCFELKLDEKIHVEQYGDISKESPNDSFQMEVKHHINQSNLTDRDSEFWNTLKNWLENKNHMNKFKELILLTTSQLNQASSFYDWEVKSANERLNILKEVSQEKKKREESFRGTYNKIFNNFNEEDIKSIVSKITIISGSQNVSLLKNELKVHPHFLNVDELSFDSYLDSLLGHIIRCPASPPYDWEISYTDFKKVTVDLRDRFSTNNRIIPNNYETKNITNVDKYMNRKFVKEIKRIKYDEMISDAINDVWRTNNTVIDYFDGNYIFFDDLKAYKKGLGRKLKIIKKDFELDYSDAEEKVRLKQSKKYFNKSMSGELEGFGMIRTNSRFFQNGIIHEIVDKGLIHWYIEGEEE